jgi:outer membrane immunogenic protein
LVWRSLLSSFFKVAIWQEHYSGHGAISGEGNKDQIRRFARAATEGRIRATAGQNNNFVFGVEGEYSWADLNGTETTISPINGFNSTVSAKLTDLALATGRFGFAANNWLLYVKAGGAWGQGSSFGTGTTRGGAFFNNTSSSTNRTGGVAGLGVEWVFASNWSAKVEYNYVDFNGADIAIASTASPTTFVHSTENISIVKAGVNYRFNWGAPGPAGF